LADVRTGGELGEFGEKVGGEVFRVGLDWKGNGAVRMGVAEAIARVFWQTGEAAGANGCGVHEVFLVLVRGGYTSLCGEEHHSIPDASPVEVLRALMEANELRQKDMVPIFGSESIVSEVLHKKRALNKTHIEKLSKQFKVSPAVFF